MSYESHNPDKTLKKWIEVGFNPKKSVFQVPYSQNRN
jgi:hypothetical protein